VSPGEAQVRDKFYIEEIRIS